MAILPHVGDSNPLFGQKRGDSLEADALCEAVNSASEDMSGRKNITKVLGVELLLSPKKYRRRDCLIMLVPILKNAKTKRAPGIYYTHEQ